MTPMNDPVIMLVNAMRSGKNPKTILHRLAGQNPQVSQLMQMMQGKSPDQLKVMAENIAKQRGMSIEDIARDLGIQIPSNR